MIVAVFPLLQAVSGTGGCQPRYAFTVNYTPDISGEHAQVSASILDGSATVETAEDGSQLYRLINNDPVLTLEGVCDSGTTVTVEGDFDATALCMQGQYTIELPAPRDGTYNLAVYEVDGTGERLGIMHVEWTLDTVAPESPAIEQPIQFNSLASIPVSGACEEGAVLQIVNELESVIYESVCAGGTYSTSITSTTYGEFDYNVYQTDAAGNRSAISSLTWVREQIDLGAPPVLTPVSPYLSSTDTVTITGLCESGATVNASVGGTVVASDECEDYGFSIELTAATEGLHTFEITQTKAHVDSEVTTWLWTLDRTAPEIPVLLDPVENPLLTNQTTLSFSLMCESGATIEWGEAFENSGTCESGAFSASATRAADDEGARTYSFRARDAAGNVSSALDFYWLLDTTAPGAPVVTSPATPLAHHYNGVSIEGTCEAGLAVFLQGADSQQAVCAEDGSFTFTVAELSDGPRQYRVYQEDFAGNLSDASNYASTTRDTIAPSAPVVTSPTAPVVNAQDSLAITGTCETGAQVSLSGSDAQSAECSSGNFSFTVSKTADGIYAFSLTQTDAAENVSASSPAVEWTRDTVAPDAPSITSPVENPLINHASSITITGGCDAGNTVELSGGSASTQIATCDAGGGYSFTVPKSSDGTYLFELVQKDSALNGSPSISQGWTRDTVAPNAPLIDAAIADTTYTQGSSLTLEGDCEADATVSAFIDTTTAPAASAVCVSATSRFTLTVSAASEGSRSVVLKQTDLAQNISSGSRTITWIYDATAPSAPVITLPTGPVVSNSGTLAIQGTCDAGSTVTLFGDDDQSVVCSAGSTFSFSVTEGDEGIHEYFAHQTDPAGNTSTDAGPVQWNRDVTAPAAPVITSPSGPVISSNDTLSITGTCEIGASVNTGGDASGAIACSDGSFSTTITKTSDAAYSFSFTQTDPAGNTSTASATVSWTRDTGAPDTPTITTPNVNPLVSNDSTITIAGACTSGYSVELSGSDVQSTLCSASNDYSFSISESVDGNYEFTVLQKDLALNASPTVSQGWVRDTAAPLAPVIHPSILDDTYTSSSSLELTGDCETNATVLAFVDGSSLPSTTDSCSGGHYTVTLNAAIEGTKSIVLKQRDLAQNLSDASRTISWTYDSTAPDAPAIVAPSAPLVSNVGAFTITGTCTAGLTVVLSGDDSQDSLCDAGGAFSFFVSESSDAAYEYSLVQRDFALNVSPSAGPVSFTLDTVAPAAPSITSPSGPVISSDSSLALTGSCETGATVALAGSDAQTAACVAGSFSFTVSKATDGIYAFTTTQTDLAGNTSPSSSTIDWTRDATAPGAPTITTPASTPLVNNASSITIGGACEPDFTVVLSGADDQTTPCSAGGEYSFTVAKSSDAGYTFSVLQKDLALNPSPAVTQEWVRDTVAPDAPVIHPSILTTTYTATGTLELNGDCEADAVVFAYVDGASTEAASTNCTGTHYNLTLTAAGEGSQDLTVKQQDVAGNLSSASRTIAWIYDATPPDAPVITVPAAPVVSNASSINIAGTCTPALEVVLFGDDDQTASCSGGGGFSFTVSETDEGFHEYFVKVRDFAGNESAQAGPVQWTRDVTAPNAPVITSPTVPVISSADTLAITGTCETGATLTMAGDDSQTGSCTGGTFSFTVSKTSDGAYSFNFTQTDPAGNTSAVSDSVSWTRDTGVPESPTITTPSVNPLVNNDSSITIAGACTAGDTVFLSGSDSQTTACAATNDYSFTVAKSTDATYGFSVIQKDAALNASASVTQSWVRDTVAPSAPVIHSSIASTTYTAVNSLELSGDCESGADVMAFVDGSAIPSVTDVCDTDHFSLTVSAAIEGTKAIILRQRDVAQNTSGDSREITWIYDETAPAAPTITAPAVDPLVNNDSTISIEGGCEAGATVRLSGSSTATATCSAGGDYAFSVSKSWDATYTFMLDQIDLTGNVSAQAGPISWVRDTVAPSAPSIITPSSDPIVSGNPITISGACEIGANVYLGGDDSQNSTCATGSYSFTVDEATDAVYSYELFQTDVAGNTSSSVFQGWVKDSSGSPPVQITFPTANPYYSNAGSLTVLGTCVNGAVVDLAGDFSDSTSCSSGTFSFTVSTTTDSTYGLEITQSPVGGAAPASSAVVQNWTRDTVAPSAPTFTSPASPTIVNSSDSVTYQGTCEAGATVVISGDDSATFTCGAGATFTHSFSHTSDGTYAISAEQTDLAGNTSTSSDTRTWTRDTSVPSAPTITSPAGPHVYTQAGTLSISGACEADAAVFAYFDGGTTAAASGTCSAGSSYSLNLSTSGEGTVVVTVKQRDAAQNLSAASNALSWTYDATAPSAPTITTPASSPLATNQNSFTVAGACETSATVRLSGDATATTTCSSSAYSFSITKSGNQSYSFSVDQVDLAGNTSTQAGPVTWIRDTVAPSAPVITSPSAPVINSANTLAISGTCEADATVDLSGSSTSLSTVCAGDSTFSVTVTKTVDGTFTFTLTQTDPAGNTSAASSAVQWTRDTAAPDAPTITTPASTPIVNNSSTFTVAGACTSGFAVELQGDDAQSTTCASNAYSFTINKSSDGTYSFTVRQKDLALNVSPSAGPVEWVRDATTPSAPTITSPAGPNTYTQSGSLSISGDCEANATVYAYYDGNATSVASGTCSVGAGYSLSLTAATEGTRAVTVKQKDAANNLSAASGALNWTYDATAPSAPTITTPASSPLATNLNSFTVAGACETAATVRLSGDASATTTCSSSAYSFSITKSGNQSYSFSVDQVDLAGNTSAQAGPVTWIRDTVAPSAPVITSPAAPVINSSNTLAINGTCEAGATVNLAGSSTSLSSSCAVNSTFSISVTKTSDGSYSFALTQTDPAGNTSAASSAVQWTRDTVPPDAPTITTPASTPIVNNASSFTVAGACDTGFTVELQGADTQSTTCASSAYSFTVNKSSDGTYSFTVRQKDLALNVSASAGPVEWVRDATAPSAPTITSPAGPNTYTQAGSLSISGGCEANASVHAYYDGNSTAVSTGTCAGDGTYTLALTTAAQGTRVITVKQKDAANNLSAASAALNWTYDSTPPDAPTITTPAMSPLVSNLSTFILAGACESAATVRVSGDSTATTTCSSGAYSFSITKTGNQSYSFSVDQVDLAGNASSTTGPVVWTRDTTAPSAPVITSPSAPVISSSDNLSINGTCEANSTVNLSGSSTSLSTTCNGSSQFSFTVTKTVDGSYSFTMTQTDPAGNTSAASSAVQWTRDTVAPNAPTITTPASTPIVNNASSFTVAGACDTGFAVELHGDDTQSTTCASSAYSFTINKSSDGTYSFTVLQKDLALNASPSAGPVVWTRDTVAPNAPTITSPVGPNYYTSTNSITLQGACEANAAVAAYYNANPTAQGWTTCSAGGTYSLALTVSGQGFRAVTVKQKDAANNMSGASAALNWTYDSTAPTAPTITTPASSPLATNQSSFTVAGACETGATVNLTGGATANVVCASSAYSFSISKSSDGTYNFSVNQVDLAGNASPTTGPVSWIRDTVAPSAPVITSPAAPVNNSANSLAVTGTCEAGATVNLSGSGTSLSSACAGDSTYSISVTKSSDGSYSFTLTQTDPAGNTSAASSAVQWTRDTAAPNAPTISTPASTPITNNASSFTVAGACDTGFTVELSGSDTQTTTCASSAYSFTINKSADGSYSFTVLQKDLALNASPSAGPVVWNRDATAPSAPTITLPNVNPVYTSTSPLAFSGGCEANATVSAYIGSSTTAAASATCAVGGTYSVSVAAASDGTRSITLKQKDAAGNESAASTAVTWTLDSVAPSDPLLTSPNPNPIYTNGSSITIAGTCGGDCVRVEMTGAETATLNLSSGAFSTVRNQSTDGTYTYTLKGVDAANNSSAGIAVTWYRDTVAPSNPVITVPSTDPVVTNTDTLTISGTCEAYANVVLSQGGGPLANQACTAGGTFSFNRTEASDGTRTYSVAQTDRAGNNSAGADTQVWTLDRSAPAAVVITSPMSNPYSSAENSFSLSGTCESGATVALTGDQSGTTTCASSSFTFTITGATDATRNYSLKQTDTAGNNSTSTAFTWNRDTNAPANPTITSPATNPAYTNTSPLAISGACDYPGSVEISGGVTASTACASNGSYSTSLSQASQGALTVTLKSKDPAGNLSPGLSFTWNYDTTAPGAPTITLPNTQPLYTNTGSINVQGACEAYATLEVSGDATLTSNCASNGTYSLNIAASTDASRNYTLKQRDRAGNLSSTGASLNWIRDTVAPSAPVITGPGSSPYTSTAGSITISGTCEAFAIINVTGAETATTACDSGGNFSFAATQSTSANFVYTVGQTDRAGNASSATASFTWTRPILPIVTSVTPNIGKAVGGDSIVISGSNFAVTPSTGSVSIGGTACTVTAATSTSITCTTGAKSGGTYSLTVTNPDTQSGSLTNSFTYIAAPTISSVSPNQGYSIGGTAITITGTNFSAGSSVKINTWTCTTPTVVSSTSITCTTPASQPAGTLGAFSVNVTDSVNQTATLASAYTYLRSPPSASQTLVNVSADQAPADTATNVWVRVIPRDETQFELGTGMTVEITSNQNSSTVALSGGAGSCTTGGTNCVVAIDDGQGGYIASATIASGITSTTSTFTAKVIDSVTSTTVTATTTPQTVFDNANFTVLAASSSITSSHANQNLFITGASTFATSALNLTFGHIFIKAGLVNATPPGTGTANALSISAKSLHLQGTGTIVTDGQGYAGNYSGSTVTGTTGTTATASTGFAGGSHGGYGGILAAGGGVAGAAYGNFRAPASFGAGPGNAAATTTRGGGVVNINVTNANFACVLGSATKITANGQAGGGAGGSVYLRCPGIITQGWTGTLEASGGADSASYGAGGGGHVAIVTTGSSRTWVGALSFPKDAAGVTAVTARLKALGGTAATNGAGGAGTIFLKHSGQTEGSLIISNNGIVPTSSAGWTRLIGFTGTAGTPSGTSVPVALTTTPALATGFENVFSNMKVRVNPNNASNLDWSDDAGFTIASNTASALVATATPTVSNGDSIRTLDVLDSFDIVNNSLVEFGGDVYARYGAISGTALKMGFSGLISYQGGAAVYSPARKTDTSFTNTAATSAWSRAVNGDDVTIDLTGGALTLSTINITGDFKLTTGTLKHFGQSASATQRFTLTAGGTVNLAGGAIDASGLGYPDMNSYAANGYATTLASTAGSGGSHGGMGGLDGGSVVGATYDSIKDPKYPGSGPGNPNTACGGIGGGVILINAGGACTLGGTTSLKANAGTSSGGAGGTINLTCASIDGTGWTGAIQANGANANDGWCAGGGGGRIAIKTTLDQSHWLGNLSFPTDSNYSGFVGKVTAFGGTMGAATKAGGGAGTIYLKHSGLANGALIVRNHGGTHLSGTGTTLVPSVSGTFTGSPTGTTAAVSISGSAALTAPSGYFNGIVLRPDLSATAGTPSKWTDDPQTTITSHSSTQFTLASIPAGATVANGTALRSLDVFDYGEIDNHAVLESYGDVLFLKGNLSNTSNTEFTMNGIAALNGSAALAVRDEPNSGADKPTHFSLTGTGALTLNKPVTGTKLTSGLTGVALDLKSITMTGNVALNSGTLITDSITADQVLIAGGSLQQHPQTAAETSRLSITVATKFEMTGGTVDVSGLGYPAGNSWAANGYGTGVTSTGTSGGSHGGLGGGSTAGAVFDNAKDPNFPGGGVGSSCSDSGGGVVRIYSAGTCRLTGASTINANGGNSTARGGTAGGSIKFDCDTIATDSWTGTASANGSPGNSGWCAGGGGGMIAMITRNASGTGAWTGVVAFPNNSTTVGTLTSKFTTYGGALAGTKGDGAPGTIYLKHSGLTDGALIVDRGTNSMLSLAASGRTRLRSLAGTVTAVSGSNVTVTASSTPTLAAATNSLYNGLTVHADISQNNGTAGNLSDDPTVVVASSAAGVLNLTGDLTGVGVNDTLMSKDVFDHLELRNGAILETYGELHIRNGSLVSQASLTGDGFVSLLTPSAVIDSGGRTIIADLANALTLFPAGGHTVGQLNIGNSFTGTINFGGAQTVAGSLTIGGGTSTFTSVTSSGAFSMTGGTTTLTGTLSATSLTMSGGTATIPTINLGTTGDLSMSGGTATFGDITAHHFSMSAGTMQHAAQTSTTTMRLKLNLAGDFTISGTAAMNVSGRGAPPGNAPLMAAGYSTANIGGVRTGGSHGGTGGKYSNGAIGPVYDNFRAPDQPGAGGTVIAYGGGVVNILALSGTCNFNGASATINANGATNGGAGGSIYIKCFNIASNTFGGTLSANGGDANSTQTTSSNRSSGGGGGRIALVATNSWGTGTTLPFPSDSTNLTAFKSRVRAAGGIQASTTYQAGGAGTIYVSGPTSVNGTLIISNGANATYSSASNSEGTTPLVSTNANSNTLSATATTNTTNDTAQITGTPLANYLNWYKNYTIDVFPSSDANLNPSSANRTRVNLSGNAANAFLTAGQFPANVASYKYWFLYQLDELDISDNGYVDLTNGDLILTKCDTHSNDDLTFDVPTGSTLLLHAGYSGSCKLSANSSGGTVSILGTNSSSAALNFFQP